MGGRLVLVVDDDPDFRAILRHILEGAGYRVAEAEDGEKGLDAAARERPELVLLDIQMPGLDGLETCRRLRDGAAGPRPPVLFLTVRSQIATVAEGLQAGARDYVLKPVDPEDLLARIEFALGGAGPA